MKKIALGVVLAIIGGELMTVAAQAQSCPAATTFRCWYDAGGHRQCGCMR